MRDIRTVLEQGVDERNFALISYTDNRNRQKPCYRCGYTKENVLIKIRPILTDRAELEITYK